MDNLQIEQNSGLNYYADVEWIDDCTYLLKNHRNHNQELDEEEIGHIYTVEILEVYRDSVRLKTTANYTDFVVERTVNILELK